MNTQVLRQLVIMDLHRFRWLYAGVLVAGAASIGLVLTGEAGVYIGSIAYLTSVLILGVLLVMLGVFQERKDNNWLFLLSLPLSPGELAFAKTAANALGYFPVWALLTGAACLAIDLLPIPNGLIPSLVALMGMLATYYVVLFAIGLVTASQTWATVAIIAGNVSVSYFIYLLGRLPGIATHGSGPVAVWSTDIVTVVAVELGLIVVTCALATRAYRRKREFV